MQLLGVGLTLGVGERVRERPRGMGERPRLGGGGVRPREERWREGPEWERRRRSRGRWS